MSFTQDWSTSEFSMDFVLLVSVLPLGSIGLCSRRFIQGAIYTEWSTSELSMIFVSL